MDTLNDMGVMDNTLFIYIVGDNGASAEGGPLGAYNEIMALNGINQNAAINMPHLDDWGGPSTFPHYAIGWAWAGDTPFQWTKQIASHYGGTTNGLVIHWPARIKDKGQIRGQFTHVTDVAPTVLEAAGLPFPKSLNGTAQLPFDGTSMIYELKFSASTFSSIIIDQRVLFKEYSEQMNIFFIKAFAKEENHIFTPSKPTLLIKP